MSSLREICVVSDKNTEGEPQGKLTCKGDFREK